MHVEIVYILNMHARTSLMVFGVLCDDSSAEIENIVGGESGSVHG